jgi:hypothetical protein
VTPCKRCGADATEGVEPYWAKDHHRLCRPCCSAVAAQLDERDKWPPVPWTEADEEVLR